MLKGVFDLFEYIKERTPKGTEVEFWAPGVSIAVDLRYARGQGEYASRRVFSNRAICEDPNGANSAIERMCREFTEEIQGRSSHVP